MNSQTTITPGEQRRHELVEFLQASLTLAHLHLGHALDALDLRDERLLDYSARAAAASFRAGLDTLHDLRRAQS